MSVYREKIVAPGAFQVKVNGTSFYQDALLRISGHKEMQGKRQRCLALLVSEPANPHDGNAIRVEILGNRVGYLPRQLAANFSDWLRMNGYGTIEASCDAMIVGGWELSEFDTFDAAEEGQFGVRLDIASLGSTEVQSCTESQFTFTPMLQGRIADNVLVSGGEAFHLQIGDRVTLWQGDNDPLHISIFARGSMAGVGRIGYVPPQYCEIFGNQMRAGLPIESHISHIQDGRCYIRFRLVSSEEVELLRQEKKETLRAELTKPYSPRKPIRAVVIRLNASTPFLKRSDRLLIKRKPTIEEFLDGDREPNLLFECVGSSGIYHCDEDKVKKKVIRLGQSIDTYEIKVCRILQGFPSGGEIEMYPSSNKART